MNLHMHAVLSHGVDRPHATLNDAENDEPSIAINVTLALSPFSHSVRVGGTVNTYALEFCVPFNGLYGLERNGLNYCSTMYLVFTEAYFGLKWFLSGYVCVSLAKR